MRALPFRRHAVAALSIVAVIAVLPFCGTAPLRAQEVRSLDLQETIDVVEIQLEVLVHDRDGHAVEGLAVDDFRVRVGGEPGEVLAVEWIGAAPASAQRSRRASSGTEAAPDDALTLVVFVDQLHITPVYSWKILGQVVEFLDHELRPGDRVMVATYDGTVEVPLPLTGDLKTVKKALVELGQLQSHRLAIDEEQRVMQQLQELQEMNFEGAHAQPCVNLEPLAIGYATATHSEMLATIGSLGQFVDTLAGLPGRKAILHVSDGLPLIAGRGPYEYIIEMCGGAEGAARGLESRYDYGTDVYDHTDIHKMRLDMMRYDTSEQWYQLAARANRNNVTFYPLQATGLRDPDFGGAAQHVRGASSVVSLGAGMNRQDSLSLVATETGGSALVNLNDASDALGRMSHDLRSYYLLSVRGTGGKAGDIHQLKVEVDRPGVDVRHRRSLHIQSRRQQVADRVLTTTLHQAADNPMGLSAELAGEEPAADDLRSVRLKLRIPLASLTLLPAGPDEPYQGRFTVFLAASDIEGRTTPVRTSTVPIRVQPGDEGSQLYTFEVEMQMRRGEHVVGFGVLDEIGGEASYLRTVVEG